MLNYILSPKITKSIDMWYPMQLYIRLIREEKQEINGTYYNKYKISITL